MSSVVIPAPPDLMRRFVARPHAATVEIDGIALAIETNDETLIAPFLRCGRRGAQASTVVPCVLLRDDEAQPSASTPIVLCHGATTVLRFGPGTQIVVDADAREVAGYVGLDMEPDFLVVCVVPLIVRALEGTGRPHL